MQQTPSSQSDLIAVLEQYQAVCNRYDVAAAVALFAADGCIEVRGIEYRGWDALHAVHECDRGSQTQVAFSDYVVEGENVRCTFIACVVHAWLRRQIKRAGDEERRDESPSNDQA